MKHTGLRIIDKPPEEYVSIHCLYHSVWENHSCVEKLFPIFNCSFFAIFIILVYIVHVHCSY